MNYELFIAKRIAAGKEYKSSISSPIIKIATLAIALGIAVMLISVSISIGFQHKIRDKMAGFKGHIQIINYDNNNSGVSITPIDKNQNFYPNFTSVKGVKHVQVFANKAGIIRTSKSFEGVIFKGVDKQYDFSFFKDYLRSGRFPNFNLQRNREVLISESIANSLHLKVGDTIAMWFQVTNSKAGFKSRKPVVVGLFNTGFEQFDKSVIIGDIREVQKINKWKDNQVGGFEVLIDDFDDMESKGLEIAQHTDPTLVTKTIVESYPAIFKWIELFDNNTWFIIIMMIIIAGINMITALLVLILERVQMVGILKALGGNNISIRKIFLFNASSLIIKGLIYGNGVGLLLLLIQKYGKVLQLNPETYYVAIVPVHLNFWWIFLLNIGTLVACFAMMTIPSVIITRIRPSTAIKFA